MKFKPKFPRRTRNELTSEQTMELLIGPVSRSAFRNDDERRAAWWAHREELMGLLPPDGRGWAWVMFEGGGFLLGEGGRITAALRRIDSPLEGLLRS